MRALLLALLVAGCGGPSMAGGGGGGGGGVDAPRAGDAAASDGPGATDAPDPTSAISVIVEPNGNHASELATAIGDAQHSVYVTMYELDNPSILGALVARQNAGLDVQVILDSSSATKSFNMPAYTTLKNAGVKVVWSSSAFTYTHEKCVILDGAVAWIMTMNATKSSPDDNREYLAIDTSPADVAEASAIFTADHAMQSIAPTGSLVVANTNARPDLVALIQSATTTLDVEDEEFSDGNQNGIVDAVVQAAEHGVAVRVIVANGNADATSDKAVKNAGGKVVVAGPTSSAGTPAHPYIHAKAILVDCDATSCAKGFVGSENMTAGSLGYNRELGVIFTAATELAKVKAAIDTDFAAGTPQ